MELKVRCPPLVNLMAMRLILNGIERENWHGVIQINSLDLLILNGIESYSRHTLQFFHIRR